MDRRGYWLLAASLVLGTVATASASNADLPLRELNWISNKTQIEAAIIQPDFGFRAQENSALDPDLVVAGEIIFHTPSLLGGQAAKAGINCASCHVNGRSNPHFQFPGVSGDPGTADVTHSFFSSQRGDGEFNPVQIPDLTQPGKIDRDADRQLEKFIRDLIVEEFDGVEPSTTTLEAIATYVRALCNRCDKTNIPITMDTHWTRVEKALQAAQKHHRKSPELARLILSGAMHQLGLVHERFAGEQLVSERETLVTLSLEIQRLRGVLRSDELSFNGQTDLLIGKIGDVKLKLRQKEKMSLYNREILQAALER